MSRLVIIVSIKNSTFYFIKIINIFIEGTYAPYAPGMGTPLSNIDVYTYSSITTLKYGVGEQLGQRVSALVLKPGQILNHRSPFDL